MTKAERDMAYQKANIKQVKLNLHITNDADILRWLDRQDNKQGSIKDLIRSSMNKEAKR